MRNKYYKLLIAAILFAYAFSASAAISNPASGIFVDLTNRGGNTFGNLAFLIIRALLTFVGIIAVLFIVVGGFQYITSGTNAELAEAGKKTLTNAIIGLVIVILSYVIVVVIINTFITV